MVEFSVQLPRVKIIDKFFKFTSKSERQRRIGGGRSWQRRGRKEVP